LATFISFLIAPVVRSTGINYGLMDKPDSRKQHNLPVVRLGGIAIVFGSVFSFLILYLLSFYDIQFPDKASYLYIYVISAFFISLIGFIDDIRPLSPFFRLCFQFVMVFVAWIYGFQITKIDFSWIIPNSSPLTLLPIFSLIITLVWVVGVINAINWIDGLDGLAGGISVIIFTTLFLFFYSRGQIGLSIYSACIAGSALGFLWHNFSSSKIIMGDIGSYFIGFNMATLSMLNEIGSASGDFIFLPQFSFLILLLPIADMIVVIVNRLKESNSPFFPDRKHFHHRLLLFGCSERRVTIIFYSLTYTFSLIALSII
tara:strand:- start:3746 stop:4690 length:945 start_codon:yes stop_codon:yes gene_type:complete